MDASEKKLVLKLASLNKSFSALIGFDGFVDEIVHVVDRRAGPDNYTRIGTLDEYTRRIGRGRALSTNIELVPVKKKLGGNGPIFAEALKKHHFHITYLGCVGKEAVDPVFECLSRDARLIGLADPGHTDAYEFTDGKIIASKTQSFKEITWDRIIGKLGLDALVRIVDSCDLVGMENWTMLPGMSDIWTHFLSDVLPRLTRPPEGIHMFFDLADPEKRDEKDILSALSLIGGFSKKGFQTALGLNKKEACEIAEIFGLPIEDYRAQPLRPLCAYLADRISVDCLVIHPVDSACCFSDDALSFTQGPFCENPVITTGAGDIFNAGFALGWMNGFSMEECLKCGVYASGYYVRRGKSPTAAELAGFIQSNLNG
jgi:hypothetical protein